MGAMSPAQSGSVLMFSGAVPFGGLLGDTLQWNNATGSWSQLAGGPPARTWHAMVFDSFRNQVVMFGGVTGTFGPYVADTWEWWGGWVQRAPLTSPPPRSDHAMAFDPVRHRVVLFGGGYCGGFACVMGDTWEWDGANWTQFAPAQNPSPRQDHGMAFDPVRGHVLLFGGDLGNNAYDGSTWEWNGTTWTQLMPAVSPAPRAWHAMATDTQRGRVLVTSGVGPGTFYDTWEWNGSVWTQLNGNASSGLSPLGRMAFCAQASRMLFTDASYTWEWNPPSPNVRSYGTGCGGLALAATPNSRPLLGQTFTSQVSGCPPATVIAFMALGFSDQVLGPFPLPLDLSGYGMPGCWLYHDAVTICLPCQLAGSVATHSIALPNDPSLTGTAAFLQGWTGTPGANPGGVLTSSALALTLGY
jgi:hypothetical protein